MTETTDISGSTTANKQQISDVVDTEFGLQEWQDRKRGEITAAKFGVVGSGTVDDSAAMNDAINTSASEGKRLLPVGKQGMNFLLDAPLVRTVAGIIDGSSRNGPGVRPTFSAAQNNLTLFTDNISSDFTARYGLDNLNFISNGKTGVVGYRNTGAGVAFAGNGLTFNNLHTGAHFDGAQFCALHNSGFVSSPAPGDVELKLGLLITPLDFTISGGGNSNQFNHLTFQGVDVGLAQLGMRAYYPKWQANHAYPANSVMVPTDASKRPNVYFYTATGGISGNTEPDWGTARSYGNPMTTFGDNTVAWVSVEMYPFGENQFSSCNFLTNRLCAQVAYDVIGTKFISCSQENTAGGAADSKALFNITINRSIMQLQCAMVDLDGYGYSDGTDHPLILIGTPNIDRSILSTAGFEGGSPNIQQDAASQVSFRGRWACQTGTNPVIRNVAAVELIERAPGHGAFLAAYDTHVDQSIPNEAFVSTGGFNTILPKWNFDGITGYQPPAAVGYDSQMGLVAQISFQNTIGTPFDNAVRIRHRNTDPYTGTPQVDRVCVALNIMASVDCEVNFNTSQDSCSGYLQLAAGIWYRLVQLFTLVASPRYSVTYFYPKDTTAPVLSLCKVQTITSMNTPGFSDSMISKVARGAWNPLQSDTLWRTNAAPSSGTYPVGFEIRNEAPTAGHRGWVLETAPHTWLEF